LDENAHAREYAHGEVVAHPARNRDPLLGYPCPYLQVSVHNWAESGIAATAQLGRNYPNE
jgi:hypothetical protein